MQVRPEVQSLLAWVQAVSEEQSEDVISVSLATKRIAFAYERFRNTLEPDEEDILRRKAIFRILERRLREDRPPLASATALLQELIRAHYIRPVGISYATRLAVLFVRARDVLSVLSGSTQDWWLRVVAVGVDRELYPRQREEALVQLMYRDVWMRTVWIDEMVAEAERTTQLYLACHRALFAADDYELTYHYWRYQFPQWQQGELSADDLLALRREAPRFYREFERVLHHPAGLRLARLMRSEAVVYRTLWAIMRRDGAAALQSEVRLATAAREAVVERTGRIRVRMMRRAWHSILFLFLTKTLIAAAIELPYEAILLGQVHYLALAMNIAFHPLLLFTLATSARLPGERNTDRLVEFVRTVVTGEGELPTVVARATRRYGPLTWSLFALVYAGSFMVIFWGLFFVLARLDFSLLAMFMFVIFLGLVSFLSIRIRRAVDDVRVITRTEGTLATIFSFLTLPVLEFGRWLAEHASRVNVALFIMDWVLEAPFKLLIDVIEEWFIFVRDRREEIV